MDAPLAKTDGLITDAIDDGLVIYDTSTQQAHALDALSSRVWRACDGRRSLPELAVEAELGEDAIRAVLDELGARGLLVEAPGLSRRHMLRRSATLGAAAVAAVPFIETVVIPTAAAHASPNPPPPVQTKIALITPDNSSAIVYVWEGTLGWVRNRVAAGGSNAKTFNPTNVISFNIAVVGGQVWFTNELPSNPPAPPYHYLITGTDGVGSPVNLTVTSVTGNYQQIVFGPKLNLTVYYVNP